MWLCSKQHTFIELFEGVRACLPDDCERLPTACMLAKATDSLQQVTVELSFDVVECCTLNGFGLPFSQKRIALLQANHKQMPSLHVIYIVH